MEEISVHLPNLWVINIFGEEFTLGVNAWKVIFDIF